MIYQLYRDYTWDPLQRLQGWYFEPTSLWMESRLLPFSGRVVFLSTVKIFSDRRPKPRFMASADEIEYVNRIPRDLFESI